MKKNPDMEDNMVDVIWLSFKNIHRSSNKKHERVISFIKLI